MELPDKLRRTLDELPDRPGCYLMRDRRGRIVYVGKALSLRKRVRSYFRDAALRNGSPKLLSLVHSVDDIEHLVARNEAEAILTEGRLIQEYRPRFNVSFKDDKRFLLLRADPREPFPRLTLCRIRRADGLLYFGPYASAATARVTLDFVERRFGLRKCRPRVPGEEDHRHCLNDILRYCSAPCVGRVSRKEYAARFRQACAFLRGELPGCLQEIADAMRSASADMDFERAAALRDTMLFLRAAVRQRAAAAKTPELKRAESAAGLAELQTALGLARPPRVLEAYDISNISGTFAVGSLVCFVDGAPNRSRYRRFRIRSVEGSDDPAMMAEVIRRRFGRLAAEGGEPPDLVLVDGGIAQLGAARAELARLNMAGVPVAGLAKRFEEIYWNADGPPLRLDRESNGLRVLQRLRDEAHRFALAYHHVLRRRRIRESVLDEIPGVGEKTKQSLLTRFGSVRRIAAAAEAEIAAVPGIGPRLAAMIRQTLTHIEPKATDTAEASENSGSRETRT
jgi:excinuclease ABC subunit C